MASIDDIPELDDMTDEVEKIKLKNKSHTQHNNKHNSTKTPTVALEIGREADKTKVKAGSGDQRKQPGEFGGMKKGFLFGGSGQTKSSKVPQKQKKEQSDEDVIPVTVQNNSKDSLVLDEVQQAMQNSASLDQSWLTDDLLKQISSNEKLFRQLSDPRIAKAVELMRTDPKSAMEYYKDDKEITLFFKEFYGILGNHFTKLSDETDTSANISAQDTGISTEDEKAVKDILSNPEIKEILMRPDVQKLIGLLRTDPEEAQRHLVEADPRLRADVKKLVSAGVLAFQST